MPVEHISYKKNKKTDSLRVEGLQRDRRRLLQEYYSVEAGGEGQETKKEEEPDPVPVDSSNPQSSTNTLENHTVRELTLNQLVTIHNRLTGKEQDTNNSIKSTIYDNYYDLVRVNTLLQSLVTQHDQHQQWLSRLSPP